MANFICPLKSIKSLDMTVVNYHDQVIWSGETHYKYGEHYHWLVYQAE